MPIRILSEAVIDQIAAGEVLERPAHLIKELVENSLDAGATEIDIEFDFGGRQVRVQDNGAGMTKEDLRLSLLRHATSKIHAAEDLYALSTFGFRGEALASVAAVSRLKITTRQKDAEAGSALTSEFGEAGDVIRQSASIGTVVEVSELFANVPARLKFLKSDAAESAQIKQVLKSLALGRPDVQFRIRSRGELVFFWPARREWKKRGEDVLEIQPLFEIAHSENDLEVRALFGSPDQCLQQNRGIWILVQGRWVQDRAINVAVLDAYRNLLMHGEYPQVTVRLQVPSDFVDVNVHPTKSQVKFVDSQRVFRAVAHALRTGLEQTPWLVKKVAPTSAETWSTPEPVQSTLADRAFATVQYQKKMFPAAEVRDAATPYRENTDVRAYWSQMEVLGQSHLTYILAQTDESFYMIDQHAAHERVAFERLMRQWRQGKFDSQAMLLPLVVELSAHEIEAMQPNFAALESLGLALETMGPDSLAITAIPAFVSETAAVHAIQSVAAELAQNGGSFAWEKKAADVFASMACHSVVRAGQTMSHEEMKNLLAQMDEFPLSSYCPHGRPVCIGWNFSELERKFGRLV